MNFPNKIHVSVTFDQPDWNEYPEYALAAHEGTTMYPNSMAIDDPEMCGEIVAGQDEENSPLGMQVRDMKEEEFGIFVEDVNEHFRRELGALMEVYIGI